MELFNYKAKDKTGQLLQGTVEAESSEAAANIIAAKGLVPLDVSSNSKFSFSFFNHISSSERVLVSRQLATMVKAGLPLSQSLEILKGQVASKHLQEILTEVSSSVEGGETLSNSFVKFPELYNDLDIAMIRSGEKSGDLDKALVRLADQQEKQQSIARKIRGALFYPAFIIVIVIAVVAFLMSYVMPQMETLYSDFGTDLPFMTKMLMAFSRFTQKYTYVVILFIVGAVMAIRFYFKTPPGKRLWDNIKISMPVIGTLVKKIYMARFTRTLSSLVAAGVPILDSLSIVSQSIGNTIYAEAVEKAREKVKSGVALSEALKGQEVFDDIVNQMIYVGEKTGEIDTMLENLATYYEDEVDTAIKAISSLIEPLLIVVLGGIVALILIAVMMPIYDISSAVK